MKNSVLKISIKRKERKIKDCVVQGATTESFKKVLVKCKDADKEKLLRKWESVQEDWAFLKNLIGKDIKCVNINHGSS